MSTIRYLPVLGIVIVFFFVSCNSSKQIASSFGKRKYTAGHFWQPASKLKTTYVACQAPARRAANNTPVKVLIKPIYSETNKPLVSAEPDMLIGKITISPMDINNSHTALKETPFIVSDYPHYKKIDTDSDHLHRPHYLGLCLICLGIAIAFVLLSNLIAFFALLAWAAFIVAAVYLILWLVSLL